MKKKHWIVLPLLALLLLALVGSHALAENSEDNPDEWTVLFYFCGSDLESKYGYASQNLADIQGVVYPDSWMPMVANFYGLDPESIEVTKPGKVNVLIETGGSATWHTQDEDIYVNMDVDTGALQRWSYNVYPGDVENVHDLPWGFELKKTLPLQSMAAPETLADFIRWGVQTCPAKKYALVLWDHGGGAMTGLFIDELFDKDIMYLYELREALAEGGVRFETLIIDACLMANIETAWNVKDYANWLVASEEIVPGKGTAVGDWLQALYAYPECDGEWLGRCVCDMTGIKYANGEHEMAKSLLTWSVIDLSGIDRLLTACGAYFNLMGDALARYPSEARTYTRFITEAESYGDGQQNMRDLGAVIYEEGTMAEVNLRVRGELMDALADAVTYIVRGPGRSAARGLSFCYPADFSEAELDIYAMNFPMPVYLAYIDAISPWTAPDWVYEQTERLPSVDDIEEFKIVPVRTWAEDGMPAVTFAGTDQGVEDVFYRLYRLDEQTGRLVRLGRTVCGFYFDDMDLVYRAMDPTHWPAIDGELCCIDMIEDNGMIRLYNIPVQINSQTSILRCGRTINYVYSDDDEIEKRYSDYEIYGVWEGYEENSMLMNRSVKPLAMLSGQEYRLLYPFDGSSGAAYLPGQKMTMYRSLEVKEIPLPEGTYYLEYEVQDSFMRTRLLDRIEFQWDGEALNFPQGDAWGKME